jgi:hypothetical protein
MKYALAILAALIATPAAASIDDMSHAEFFTRSQTGEWKDPVSSQAFTPDKPRYVTKRVVQRLKNGKKRVRYVRVEVKPEVHIAKTSSNLKKQAVADMVAAETRRRMGEAWVPTALRLATIESGFNCAAVGPNTRHGRARGVLQVMPGSARALGFNPSRLNECGYGIAAGIAHMQRCYQAGAKTHAQMAACHVAGWGGFNRQLARRSEVYKLKYVRMAMR